MHTLQGKYVSPLPSPKKYTSTFCLHVEGSFNINGGYKYKKTSFCNSLVQLILTTHTGYLQRIHIVGEQHVMGLIMIDTGD